MSLLTVEYECVDGHVFKTFCDEILVALEKDANVLIKAALCPVCSKEAQKKQDEPNKIN